MCTHRRNEQSRGESARSSPNSSHMNSSQMNSSQMPLAHPTDLSHSNSLGGRGGGKGITVTLPSPRAVRGDEGEGEWKGMGGREGGRERGRGRKREIERVERSLWKRILVG